MSQETEWFEGRNQEEPPETRRVIVECVLGILIGVALAGAMRSAYADSFKSSTASFVRHQAQCDDPDILTHLLRLNAGTLLDQFKKATLTWGGRDWRSCWIEIEGYVYSIDEEGAPLEPIPANLFKEVGGA